MIFQRPSNQEITCSLISSTGSFFSDDKYHAPLMPSVTQYFVRNMDFCIKKIMQGTKPHTIIQMDLASVTLLGHLMIPENATGIVLFSHGSGSSRFSSRNNYVAEVLQNAGFATLLFDLLTEVEDQEYKNRFNIELITGRLLEVTDWIYKNPSTQHLAIGYFGASTGAASALKSAAQKGNIIKAVVSRGGRPDLAMKALPRVECPTLLIVGQLDDNVLSLNQNAFRALKCEKDLQVIPKATHLFPEPGALEEVAKISAKWFGKYI